MVFCAQFWCQGYPFCDHFGVISESFWDRFRMRGREPKLFKNIYKKPTKYSKPLAKIEKGRLLIVKKCEKNWCNIKTDKFSGWINKNNIWGEIN